MIWATTKELYAMFLDSDWWRSLSKRKKRKVGKCEHCATKKHLTSHHVVYRENWFDTRLEDLKVLCWPCHRETHINGSEHLSKTQKRSLRAKLVKPLRVYREPTELKQLQDERSRGLITRQEFLRRKSELRVNPVRTRRRRRHRLQGAAYDPKAPWHIGIYEGITPAQAVAQIGSAGVEFVDKRGKVRRVHKFGAQLPPSP